MATRRLVQGVFRTPDGTIWSDRSLTWYRQPRKTRAQGGAVVLDQPFVVLTDSAGGMSQEMEPGAYSVLVRLGDADRYFEVGVPEGQGTFDVADGVEAAVPFVTPSLVQEAIEAAQNAAESAAQSVALQSSVPIKQFSASHTLELSDAGHLLVFEGEATLTIPSQADVAWTTSAVLQAVQTADATLTIAAGAGVTLVAKMMPPVFPKAHVVAAVRLVENQWLLAGDFQ